MYGDIDVGYRSAEGRDNEIIELPFVDNRHSMVVVLPSTSSSKIKS